jgi:hypothetical protein
MLDEPGLQETFRRNKPDGREVADEAMVWLTLSSTLRAVAELHRKNPGFDIAPLLPKIDALAEHANPSLRGEAMTTRNTLNSN